MGQVETISRLREEGVGATPEAGKVRMVTHLGIADEDIGFAIQAWRRVAAAGR